MIYAKYTLERSIFTTTQHFTNAMAMLVQYRYNYCTLGIRNIGIFSQIVGTTTSVLRVKRVEVMRFEEISKEYF